MAVEILVLSGSRQGERFQTQLEEFRAGGIPQCDLFFDPQIDEGARDRAVSFALGDDGWKLHAIGASDVLLNNAVVTSQTRVRSGDVVRMSSRGPEFSFEILGRVQRRVPLDATGPSTVATKPTPTAVATAPSVVASPERTEPSAAGDAISGKYWAATAVVTAAAIVLFVGVLIWQVLDRGSGAAAEKDVARALNGDAADAHAGREERLADEPESGDTSNDEPSAPATTAPVQPPHPSDPWAAVLDRLRKSIFLIAVEEPKTYSMWPLASACAIGDTTLLTCASAATELEKFRKKGWKLWAINEPTGQRFEIQNTRVHIGFQTSIDKPDEAIYFDFGLLTSPERVPDVAELATPQDLAGLEAGAALACVGIPREVEAISRFQTNEAELHKAKIFIVTSLPPAPGPRLLHLKADLPIKPYGSPLVNAEGKVCAVFAESAEIPNDEGGELKLHYAPVIDRKLVEAGLSSANNEFWLTPIIPEAPAPEPATSK